MDAREKEISEHAQRIVQEILKIPAHLRKEVVTEIIMNEHRTNQQLIFSRFIGPLVSAYNNICESKLRWYIDGRNENTYNWCVKAVSNDNDPIFPLV